MRVGEDREAVKRLHQSQRTKSAGEFRLRKGTGIFLFREAIC